MYNAFYKGTSCRAFSAILYRRNKEKQRRHKKMYLHAQIKTYYTSRRRTARFPENNPRNPRALTLLFNINADGLVCFSVPPRAISTSTRAFAFNVRPHRVFFTSGNELKDFRSRPFFGGWRTPSSAYNNSMTTTTTTKTRIAERAHTHAHTRTHKLRTATVTRTDEASGETRLL